MVIAANFTAEERNAEFKFQFMLHADKESASKWKDLEIPFPAGEGRISSGIAGDSGGLTQLMMQAPHIPISYHEAKGSNPEFRKELLNRKKKIKDNK